MNVEISAKRNTPYFYKLSLIDRLCFDLFFKLFCQKFNTKRNEENTCNRNHDVMQNEHRCNEDVSDDHCCNLVFHTIFAKAQSRTNEQKQSKLKIPLAR